MVIEHRRKLSVEETIRVPVSCEFCGYRYFVKHSVSCAVSETPWLVKPDDTSELEANAARARVLLRAQLEEKVRRTPAHLTKCPKCQKFSTDAQKTLTSSSFKAGFWKDIELDLKRTFVHAINYSVATTAFLVLPLFLYPYLPFFFYFVLGFIQLVLILSCGIPAILNWTDRFVRLPAIREEFKELQEEDFYAVVVELSGKSGIHWPYWEDKRTLRHLRYRLKEKHARTNSSLRK